MAMDWESFMDPLFHGTIGMRPLTLLKRRGQQSSPKGGRKTAHRTRLVEVFGHELVQGLASLSADRTIACWALLDD